MREQLLREHPDMCGLFISGGGMSGALAASRDSDPGDHFVAVGYELFDATRSALIDGTLTMVLAHPLDAFAQQAIATMIKAKRAGPGAGSQNFNQVLEFILRRTSRREWRVLHTVRATSAATGRRLSRFRSGHYWTGPGACRVPRNGCRVKSCLGMP